MVIILFTNDLMTSAGVASALRGAGFQVQLKTTAEACLAAVAQDDVRALIVDLQSLDSSAEGFFSEVRRTADRPLLLAAYAQHVHERLLDAARQQGVELVMTRGQFHREGAGRLAQAIAAGSSPAAPAPSPPPDSAGKPRAPTGD